MMAVSDLVELEFGRHGETFLIFLMTLEGLIWSLKYLDAFSTVSLLSIPWEMVTTKPTKYIHQQKSSRHSSSRGRSPWMICRQDDLSHGG
jgi:hypothetical protein